jgi:hypothetical protein
MCTPVRFRWLTSCWTIWFLSLLANPVHAQFKVLTDLDIRISDGDELALFFEWDGSDAVEAFAVRVPDGWTVLDAATSDDRGQFVPASLEPSSADESLWFVRSMDGQVIQAGQDVRLAIQTGNAVTSLIRVAPASIRDGNLVLSGRDETEMPVSILEQNARIDNFALRVSDASKPLLLETPVSADLTTEDSWTLTFRVRSAGLSQTVVSSWTGYESDPYPMEAIVDGAGHVTVYTHRGERHFAMRSKAPLADGSWHHVAVVHDGAAWHMKLVVDGVAVDSLQFNNPVTLPRPMPAIAVGNRLDASRRDLSSPFRGELDDISLSAAVLSESSVKQWVTTGKVTSERVLWSINFNTEESVLRAGLDWDSLDLVPSPLTFRTAASDVRAEQVPEGVHLSFLPGDDSVLWYEIEVSADGETFRPATRLDMDGALGSRLEWLDRTPTDAVRHYRVTTLHRDASEETSRVIKVGLGTDEFENRVLLEGNFPNPFNPTTTIRYEVFEREHVRVSVWDLAGQMIAQPVDAEHGPGRYEVGFDAGSLPSGTYFVRLENATGIQTHQMILMK